MTARGRQSETVLHKCAWGEVEFSSYSIVIFPKILIGDSDQKNCEGYPFRFIEK